MSTSSVANSGEKLREGKGEGETRRNCCPISRPRMVRYNIMDGQRYGISSSSLPRKEGRGREEIEMFCELSTARDQQRIRAEGTQKTYYRRTVVNQARAAHSRHAAAWEARWNSPKERIPAIVNAVLNFFHLASVDSEFSADYE